MPTENEGVGKKILIVDDNQDNRELVVKILKRCGYATCEAVDGEEALAKATSDRPDLILMDIALPKIDGLEATRQLRQMAGLMDTPIIALTAHAMKGDREKALAAGCSDYIAKPINVRELPEQIARNLN
ncbi:MAG: response regulator [Proteobacteria bacterium]|nr:response regulator [Pseudomonadota bacterium]